MANLSAVKFDKEVKEFKGETVIVPKDDYIAVIIDDLLKDNKSNTGKILELTLQIVDGQYKNEYLLDRINLTNPQKTCQDIGQGTLKRICNICKVAFPPNDSKYLHGKKMLISVNVESYEDSNGVLRQSNKITKYKPIPAQIINTEVMPPVVPEVKSWGESEAEIEVKSSRKLWFHKDSDTYFETFGDLENITTPHPIDMCIDVTGDVENEAKFEEIKKEDCPF